MIEINDRAEEWKKKDKNCGPFTGINENLSVNKEYVELCNEMAPACEEYILERSKLKAAVKTRLAGQLASKDLKVEFKPKNVPITYDVTNGTVSVACDIDVGIGTFSISERDHPGVHYLIIVADGKRRKFKLDGRTVTMPVPASQLTITKDTIILDTDAVKANQDKKNR